MHTLYRLLEPNGKPQVFKNFGRPPFIGPVLRLRRFVAWSLFVLIFSGCQGPAQIGSSDEVLAAVDALYTAVSSRRVELLEKSAARIEQLHTSGELPEAAYRQLKPIIDDSRAGHWDTTVRRLHEFIRGQRRAKT